LGERFRSPVMDKDLSKRYQDLLEELKALFKDLAALKLENERLAKENITLREEVSLLRLYIDTYQQEGETVEDLAGLDLHPAISKDALEFYESLPPSFNFSELFELADMLGVEKQRMKGFLTTYLRENMMQQHGTRVEKIGRHSKLWERPLGREQRDPHQGNLRPDA
jgi:regulator of replication initiation timing